MFETQFWTRRLIPALLLSSSVGLASCKTPPEPAQSSAENQADVQADQADKTAKPDETAENEPVKTEEQNLVKSEKSRDLTPEVPIAQVTDLSRSNRQFALDLYRNLAAGDGAGNLFLSPHSISVALAMSYAGARDKTADQMAETLHFALPQEKLHPTFNALNLALNGAEKAEDDERGTPFELHAVNAIWGQDGHSFVPDYLDLLAVNYGAGLHVADFKTKPDAARQRINTWVEEQTNDRIEDLLPGGSVTSMTKLILTNAIYFKANWLNAFQKEATKEAAFTLADGKSIKVPMMQNSATFNYSTVDGHQIIELPYVGNQVAMLVVLPAEGKFDALESSLDLAKYDELIGALTRQYGTLKLPRFTFDSSFTLGAQLKKMGMKLPFSTDADFSGIDGTKELFIDDVIHKAFVAVDEKGTEAAAATAVVMRTTSMPVKTFEMTVDRPFLFFIQHKPTGELLFVGRVMDPR